MEGEFPKHIKDSHYRLSNGTIAERRGNARNKQIEIYRRNANFTAVFQRCLQVGPDDFETRVETKQLTPDTTIGELQEWYGSKSKGRMNITISEEWVS